MSRVSRSIAGNFSKGLTFYEMLAIGSILAIALLLFAALRSEDGITKSNIRANDVHRSGFDHSDTGHTRYVGV